MKNIQLTNQSVRFTTIGHEVDHNIQLYVLESLHQEMNQMNIKDDCFYIQEMNHMKIHNHYTTQVLYIYIDFTTTKKIK